MTAVHSEVDLTTNALQHLARAIDNVPDPYLSCKEAYTQLPNYIEDEVSGFNVALRYPSIKQHLDLCSACENEYIELLELAIAEDAGLIS